MRNRFMFIKDNLHPVMEKIVLLHELGHDSLHREEATQVGGFKEFEVFNMTKSNLEYEANIFAAQLLLPDDVVKEMVYNGYDSQKIAQATGSEINLVALKVADLVMKGMPFRKQEYRNRFY